MSWETYNFSDDFQDALLACVITYPERFDVLGGLVDPTLFNGVAAFETVHNLSEYYKKYNSWPNFTTLANYAWQQSYRLNPDKAKEMSDYVAKVAKADIKDVDAIFDLAREFARERALYRAIRLAHTSLVENREIKGGLIPMFEKALALGTAGDDMGIILNDSADKVIKAITAQDYGISTGFEPFGEIWKQGWPAGWLIVPLAPPKRYKTTFCINMALNMALAGVDVIYYACEISQELAAVRTLCALSGQTMDQLYDAPNKFAAAVRGQLGYLEGRVLFKGFGSKSATISQIKAHARNAIRTFDLKPRAIFIDYAETVQGDNTDKNAPDWRRQADIYIQARSMGKELGACVIMPDRCNAETVDKAVPNMRSFQGAFEKAGVVDAAIGLCQTEAENLQNRVRYFIFLNRHGKALKHYEGKVDPERYQMTVDKEIGYNPDEEEVRANRRRGGGGGGGGARRREQPREMAEGAAFVQQDDAANLPKQE